MILWAFTEHASQQRKRVTDRAIPSRDLSPQSTFTPHDWTRLWAMMEPVVLRHAHAFKQQVSWAPLTRIAEMPVPPPAARHACLRSLVAYAYCILFSADRCWWRPPA
jgi:hypothetical protein